MTTPEPTKKPAKRKPRTRRNRDAKPYLRKADQKWVAVAYDSLGRRKPCYGNTSKEAEDKRKRYYAELEAQQPVTVGNTTTLGKYLEGWVNVTLKQRVAAGRLEEGTLDSYRDNCEKHITPHLGKVPIVDLSTHHIRTWLLELSTKPSGRQRRVLRAGEKTLPPPVLLSTRTQNYAHAILRKALADAVDDEIIKRNVCLLVDPPVIVRKATRTPNKQEAMALLAAAAGDRLWAYWLVVLALGLRRGEGLGMRWTLTDLDEGTTKLEKQIVRRRGEKNETTGVRKGELVEKKLKTEVSKATMRLPEMVTEALKEHRKAQAAEILASRVWADEDLVFASTVGTPLEPRNMSRAWDLVCERAGHGSFRIHDLRHAAATFLFAEGLDTKVVQSALRHSRLATTSDIYIEVLEEVRDGATSAMNGVLMNLTAAREKRDVG
jgi:integrase